MRLIDADALKNAIKDNGYSHYFEIFDIIDNAPTVSPFAGDVREIYSKIMDMEFEHSNEFWIITPKGKKIYFEKKRPHGEWSDESKDSLLCSACGKRVYKPFIGGFPTERTSHYYPNFCAFCGADMRGEADNGSDQ